MICNTVIINGGFGLGKFVNMDKDVKNSISLALCKRNTSSKSGR